MKIVILVLTTMWGDASQVDVVKFTSMEECEVARVVLLKRQAIFSAKVRQLLADRSVQGLEIPSADGLCKEISN